MNLMLVVSPFVARDLIPFFDNAHLVRLVGVKTAAVYSGLLPLLQQSWDTVDYGLCGRPLLYSGEPVHMLLSVEEMTALRGLLTAFADKHNGFPDTLLGRTVKHFLDGIDDLLQQHAALLN